MIGKHKRIVCIMIMIMLLFSQGFPTFASQGTGSVTDVVVETDDGLVIVSIGAYAMALADGPGNETYDYMAGEGVPLVRAIGSGDKFINIREYAVVLADTGNVPDAIAAATALGREHTSTFKVLKAFDEDGKPILEPLFIDIIYASTVETDFDITVSFGTSEDELISLLRATVDVLGSNNERATATINWTLEEGYDGYVEGTYLATGVLTLPEGWSGNPDNVKATVTVLPQEHLVLWLDAADYNASTGVWPDKSGFDNTVSQADEAKRPSRANPEELDGLPAVRFNGDNQYLDLQWNMDGGSFEANEITVFMVLKSYNMEDSQTVMGNYGEEGDVCFHISTRQNVLTAAVTHSDDQDVRLTFSDSLEPIIASYRVTPTDHTAYVNGSRTSTGSLSESIDWGASTIGRNGGTLSENIREWHWEGYIAEIRIYNYAMDDWERNAVEQELERKWFSPINPEPIAAVHFMPFPRLWAGSSNVAPGATVGIMSARGGIGSVNYSFVEGEGDTHNNRFTIVGNEVRVGDTALSQGIYSFRIRGQDDVAQTEYYFSIAILENLESSDVTILTNPYSEVDWETFNQYKANFHTHTNQSDGGAGPAAVIEAYADAGYSILALTDHDSNNPDTTWPWTKWISQGPVLINYRSDEKHEDYETSALYTDLGSSGDKTILAVRGNELSSTHHTSSLFSEYGGPRSGEEYKAIQEIRDRGGLAILNHPGRPGFTENRADEWYADIYTEYQGTLIGMEVHNQGDRYPGDRERWDRVNAMLMPDIVVWGYSNDDMHQIDTHTFRNYQFMLMEELSEEALRNALLTGASYFCYEPGRGLSGGEFAGDHQVPLIEEIVVNDTNEVTIIEIDVHDENTADTITWWTDKREIQGNRYAIDLNELDLDEDKFIRAELENNYGRTYTQPFVLGYEPLEEIRVTDVGIVEEDQVLEVGDTLQLTAVIAPANATEKGVSWSSANEEVASVSGSGLVTALSGGTALITVTTVDGGFTDYVTITVKGPDQPEPMEGLVLWLDASAVEGLKHGETVETWNDLSGKGNDAVQANKENQPSYGTGYNGWPAIHFDGNDDCLDLDWEGSGGALKPDSNSMTIFIVLSHNDFMGDSQTIMGNMSTEGDVWIHKSGSEDRTYAVVNGNRSDADRLVYFGESEDDPGFHVLTWQYDHDADTGKHRSYVNGVHIDSASEAVTIDLGPMSIGRNRLDEDNQWHWKGYIAEIRIYDRALEDAERQAVENELRDKWFSELPPKPISAIHFTAVTGLREGTGSVAAGATVGTLSATDGIGNITYSLVPGEDDDDSDSFTIEGNEVKVASAALTAGEYSFWVKGKDEEGHEVVASFTVTVFEKTEFLADGLVLHLDAADYNEATGEWVDKTAINSVSQAMESSRPTKIDDGLNGLPVVRFDGTDQHLNLDWGDDLEGSLGTDGITIFLVMRDGGERSRQVIMGNYGSANQLAISKSSQGQYPIIARIYGSSQSSFDSCEFTNETGPYVLTFDYDNKTMRTFVDGEAANTQSSSRAVKWADTAIGRSGTGSANYWSGDIAEIIIYDTALSDDDRQAVEQYLKVKWFSEPPPKPISAIHFTAVTGLREGTGSVAAGATVGTLSATDGIGNITYSLVAGEDDSDSFTIEGNEVKVASEALTARTYNFRVKGEDEKGNDAEGSFAIIVLKELEFPLDGLVLHLNAADYNQESGEWPDRSNINNIVFQNEPGSRPTKHNDGFNGLPVVRFNGTDQYLNLNWGDALGDSLETDEITIILVMQDGGKTGNTQVIIGNYGSANQLAISKSSRNPYAIVARIYGSSTYDFDSCEFTTETGPYVLTFDYDNKTMRTFVDGKAANTQSSSRAIEWADTAIGCSGTGSANYWSGDIAEIIIYNRVLTDEERAFFH